MNFNVSTCVTKQLYVNLTDLIVSSLLSISVRSLTNPEDEMNGRFGRPFTLSPVNHCVSFLNRKKKNCGKCIGVRLFTFEMRRHLRRWLASLYGDSKKKLHCWCYCNELTYRRHCGARRPVRAEHSSRIQRPLDRREAPRSAEVSGRKTLPTSSSQPLLQLFFFLNFRINNNIISAIFHQVYTKSVLYIYVCAILLLFFFFSFVQDKQSFITLTY